MQKILVAALFVFLTCNTIDALGTKKQTISEFAVGLRVLDVVIHDFMVGQLIIGILIK